MKWNRWTGVCRMDGKIDGFWSPVFYQRGRRRRSKRTKIFLVGLTEMKSIPDSD